MTLDRVAVVGVYGAGKSTLARTLATKWDIPVVDFDDLAWTQEARRVGRRAVLRSVLERDRWILAGSMAEFDPEIFSRADLVVWLDLSYAGIVVNVLRRSIDHPEKGIWNGVDQRRRNGLDPRLVIRSLVAYHKRRQGLHDLSLASAAPVVRLRSRADARLLA